MTYNYNRLRKLLIDEGITKTEMHKTADINTSILAKRGKNEIMSIDALTSIVAVMESELDDMLR